MALFAVANSGLTPVHEQRLDRHQAEHIVRLLRQHIVEIACVPFLPVAWEDDSTLLAVDASGGAVVVQLRQYLSAMELFSLMSRSGRYAHMSRADFVTRFDGGAAAYDEAWSSFSQGLARVRGPRLVIVVVEVEEEVYPLLSNLSDGVLVVRASVYRNAEGGQLLEVEPLRKALVSVPHPKSAGISDKESESNVPESKGASRNPESYGHLSGILAGLPTSEVLPTEQTPSVGIRDEHSALAQASLENQQGQWTLGEIQASRGDKPMVGDRRVGAAQQVDSEVDVFSRPVREHQPTENKRSVSEQSAVGRAENSENVILGEVSPSQSLAARTEHSSSVEHSRDADIQAQPREGRASLNNEDRKLQSHVNEISHAASSQDQGEKSSRAVYAEPSESQSLGPWSTSVSRRRTYRHQEEMRDKKEETPSSSFPLESRSRESFVDDHSRMSTEIVESASVPHEPSKKEKPQDIPSVVQERTGRRASRRRMSEGKYAPHSRMLLSNEQQDDVSGNSSVVPSPEGYERASFPRNDIRAEDFLGYSSEAGRGELKSPEPSGLGLFSSSAESSRRAERTEKTLFEAGMSSYDRFTHASPTEKTEEYVKKETIIRESQREDSSLSAEERETPTYVSIRKAREARKIRKEQLLWERSAPSRQEEWTSDTLSESSAARSSDDAVTRAAEREYLSSQARLQAIALRIQAPIVLCLESMGQVSVTGRLTAWGTIQVGGMTYYDPSEAAAQVTGNASLDGWTAWKALDGRTLAEL